MSDWSSIIPKSLVDITDRFVSACRISLLPGELCHGKWFTLQYVISAIEIMDPKMDAMMSCNHRYVTVADVLKSNDLPLGPFTEIATLTDIMDHLLASFVNWLTGDSLAQSVFTCMYMHCTHLIRDKYLRLFCEVLRRIINELRSVIIQMSAFDEEDHYHPTHGMPINEPFMFEQTPDPGSELLYKFSSEKLIESAKHLSNEIATDSRFSNVEPALMQNLRLRIEFVAFLLEFTRSLFTSLPPSNNDTSDDFEGYPLSYENSVLSNIDLKKNEQVITDTVPTNLWEKLYQICFKLEPILNNLISVTQNLESSVTANGSQHDVIGFEPSLNQSSLPSCMPRLILIHEHKSSYLYFVGLFKHLNDIVRCFKAFSSWHRTSPSPLYLNVLWAAIQKYGQKPSLHVKELLSSGTASDACSTALSSCIVSRTFVHFLYFTLIQNKKMPTLEHQSNSLTHYECFLNSWMQLEPNKFHKHIREIIGNHIELDLFFTDLSDLFARIPALYCLNRSRQRSVLVTWLAKLPELLSRCNQAQNMIGIGLAYSADCKTESSTQKIIEYINNYSQNDKPISGTSTSEEYKVDQPAPVSLNLVCYVCYIYLYLAWDYLVSGFQLELHAPHEWVFIYTFMIQLFRNLGELVERISCNYLSLRCSSVDSLPTTELAKNLHNNKSHCCDEDHNHVQSSKAASRRRNRKKNRPTTVQTSQNEASLVENKSVSKPFPTINSFFPGLHEIGSNCEMYTINVHQCLNSGTIYALRALQRDSGGEPILDSDLPNYIGDPQNSDSFCLNSFFESYARRLGIFLIHPNSPLSDPAGVMAAYDSWRTFLAHELIKNRSTSMLYSEAATAFDHALNMIEAVKKAKQICEKSTHDLIGPQYEWFSQMFGPPDDLAQLEKLAKWNSIACRVLATCEDRRPTYVAPQDNLKIGPQKCAFLLKSSPVQLDFNFLESRTYPLIRLVSTSTTQT